MKTENKMPRNFLLSDEQAEIETFEKGFFSFLKNPKSFKALKDFSYVIGYIKAHPSLFKISLFFFVICFLTTLMIPKAIGYLVDEIFQNQTEDRSFLIYCFLGLYSTKIIFESAYKWNFAKLGELVLKDLREDINRILSTLPVKFYDQNSSGKIISRGVNDVTNLALIFNPMMYHTLGDCFIILGSLCVLLYSFPIAGLLFSFLALFLSFSLFRFSLLIGRKVRKKRTLISKVNTYVSDTINGLELIYANGYIKRFQKSYDRLIRLYYLSSEKLIKIWGKFPTIHAICLGLAFSFIALYFGRALHLNEISKGQFISLIFYSSMIFVPFHDIAARQNEFQDGMSSMSKIKDILDMEVPQSKSEENKGNFSLEKKDITFDHVKFGYDEGAYLFDDLNFTMPGGKITAIIGRTGSGKTSITSLLTRLYEVNSGSINIGEHDISTIPLSLLNKKVGIVTQQLFLFKDTLRENLRLYDKNISDEKINSLLNELGLYDKIQNLPNKLDTFFDEKKQQFSTGERQLIVLGRMILADPAVLIFDEATASLDNVMEKRVQDSLEKLLPGRTTIMIAHRLSTIEMAENIIVFSHGKIVESGSPETLMEKKGHYYQYRITSNE